MKKKPVTRVDALTPEQTAQMAAHADRWIEIGLRTGNADRATFEAAAKECYEFAGIPWPGRVVWVSSPIVMAIAAPVAALILQLRHKDAVRGAVRDAVGGAVDGAVGGAVGGAVDGAVGGAVDGAVGGAVGDAVGGAVDGAVDDAVDGAVRGAVRGAVDGAVDDAVDGAVRGAVRGAVDGAVGDAVRGAVRGAVDGAVGDAVDGAVRGAVGDAVRGAVRGAVGDAVDGAVDGAVRGAVRGAVGGAVGDGAHLRRAVADVIRRAWSSYLGGQFWVGGWYWGPAFTSFFREVCGLELSGDLWARGQAYERTVQSACWWYPHRDFVMVCERPTAIHRELANPASPRGWGSHRLHNTQGAAVRWRDGWGVYAVHGVRIPAWIIDTPQNITPARIDAEANAEIRRVMLESYGWARYIRDCGARVVDEVGDDHEIVGLRGARLLRKELQGEPEPIVYLDMVNSTAEADGTFKRYLERIDPKMYDGAAGRSCHAAMASRWMYRNDRGELVHTFSDYRHYRPAYES